MTKNVSDIVKDVEICIDEIAQNDAEFEGTQDDTERSTIIKSKIPEALRFVYCNADWSMLDPDSVLTAATSKAIVTGSTINKGVVSLKDKNFLRLVYAKYPSWKRYLGQEDLIMWNDKEYAMLSDEYCTGTNERPKIAMVWNSTDKELELYCVPTGESPSVGIMVEPEEGESASGETQYKISDRVYRAVIYYISGLVFVTYADQQKASMMFEQANDIIGFSQSVQQANQ